MLLALTSPYTAESYSRLRRKVSTMLDNPNIDKPITNNSSENSPLDAENWEHAFEPYDGFPGQALMLGFNFMVLKAYIAIEPLKIQEAIKGFDCAMEVLFKHTQFHEIAYGLFHRLIEGQLTVREEQLLKSLGLQF